MQQIVEEEEPLPKGRDQSDLLFLLKVVQLRNELS